MTSPKSARTEILKGKGILLRPIDDEDTANIVTWRNSPKVRGMLLGQEDLTPERHHDWLARFVRTGKCLQYIIHSFSDGDIGTVFLKNRTPSSAEFGIFIGVPSAWGKGCARESTELLLGHAFSTLALRTVWLRVFEHNARAIALYERMGFKKTGSETRALEKKADPKKILRMEVTAQTFFSG